MNKLSMNPESLHMLIAHVAKVLPVLNSEFDAQKNIIKGAWLNKTCVDIGNVMQRCIRFQKGIALVYGNQNGLLAKYVLSLASGY